LVIEWIGCSGVGKSTLYEAVCQHLLSSGINARKPLEIFLGRTVAQSISNERLQNVFLDLLVLPWSLISAVKYRLFYSYCLKVLSRDYSSYAQRIKLLRSILRKTGLHTFLSRVCHEKQALLVDEGTVHIAHLLFANGDNNSISPKEIERFCELVPVPGLIIHIIAPESDTLKRTLNRHDKPIADTSPDAIKRFIGLGHEIFKTLNDLAPWENKTITVPNPNNSLEGKGEIALNIANQITDYLSLPKK
jgi:hypothetical protein